MNTTASDAPRWRTPPLGTACQVVTALCCVTYAALLWQQGQAAGITAPLGEDGPIWSGTSRLADAGGVLGMSPLYPRLTALLAGDSFAAGGLLVNGVAMATLGVLALLGALWALPGGMPRLVASIIAPLVAVSAGNPAGYIWFVHPEVLVAACMLAVAAFGGRYAAAPSIGRSLAFGLACGAALTAREHGLVVVVLGLPLVAAMGHGPLKARAMRLGVWVAGVALVVLLAAQHLSPDALGGATSLTKATVALRDSRGWAERDPGRVGLIPAEMSTRDASAMRAGSHNRVVVSKAAAGLGRWWEAFTLGLLGIAALLWRRRVALALALALPMATLTPSLVVWTEPRHFLVVAPAAALAGVIGLAHLLSSWPPRRAALTLGAGGVAGLVWCAPGVYRSLDTTLAGAVAFQQRHAQEYSVIAWLHKNVPDCAALTVHADPTVLGKVHWMPLPPPGAPPGPHGPICDHYMVTTASVPDCQEMFSTGRLKVCRKRTVKQP